MRNSLDAYTWNGFNATRRAASRAACATDHLCARTQVRATERTPQANGGSRSTVRFSPNARIHAESSR